MIPSGIYFISLADGEISVCPHDIHAKETLYLVAGNDIHYPRQANHDACFIPESVRQYTGEPLYILVAYWCLQQKDWIQYSQIAEAFHITARRVSCLVFCLRNKAGRVDCECRKSVPAGKVSRSEIRVTAVRECPLRKINRGSPTLPVTRRRERNAGTDQTGRLWNQLCQQRKAGRLLRKKEADGE